MLEFINLFIVPFITLNGIYKRKKVEKKLDASFIIDYAISVIAVYICTYVVMAITTLAINIGGDTTSKFYLFVAIIVAFIIPYVYEIFKKFVEVSFEVKADRK